MSDLEPITPLFTHEARCDTCPLLHIIGAASTQETWCYADPQPLIVHKPRLHWCGRHPVVAASLLTLTAQMAAGPAAEALKAAG